MRAPADEAIRASFLRLLEERPLREITVRDIVEDCGVNRNTFYYHFRDIPSLLEDLIADQAERIIASQGPALSLAACLETAAEFTQAHRQAVLHITQSPHRDLFERCLLDVCRRVVEDYASAAIGSRALREEDRAVIVRFYQCECFGQVMAWLHSGMRGDLAGQFRRLCHLAEGMTEQMLRRAAEEAKSIP